MHIGSGMVRFYSQGSVAALKKKTLRDKVELQAELDRTKQWVLKKEKGL